MNPSRLPILLAGALPVLIAACQPTQNQAAVGTAPPPAAIESAEVHGESGLTSQVVESRWIRPMVGEQDSNLGARIESVEVDPDTNTQRVSIALPRDGRTIEEVVVYGRTKDSPKRKPLTLPVDVEVLSSPEKNGIVIHLPKVDDFVLRINYYEEGNELNPDPSQR